MNKREPHGLWSAAGLVASLLFLPLSAGALADETNASAPPGAAASDPPSGAPDPGDHHEQEAASPVSISWDATLASRYFFQGVDFSYKHPVLQPEIVANVKGVSATLWLNYDLHDREPNEVDASLQYDWTIRAVSLSAGYLHVDYPHRVDTPSSQELFASAAYSGPLNPSLSVHYDFDAGKGSYSTLELSHKAEIPGGPVSLGTRIFYQQHYYDLTGFPAVELYGSRDFTVASFTITPSISYFATWENGDFRGDNAVPDNWLFSVNISQTFE